MIQKLSPSIKSVKPRFIIDSRGMPTVEVDIYFGDEARVVLGRASAPSGASRGKNEAFELRDKTSAFGGHGVMIAINNIRNIIAPKVLGIGLVAQHQFDQILIELDATENKSALGANAILPVSVAYAKAVSKYKEIELFEHLRAEFLPADDVQYKMPTPMFNFINGGAHANNKLEIQEFMIVPVMKGLFVDKIQAGAEIFLALKDRLNTLGYSTAVGDEGGICADIKHAKEALDLLCYSVEHAGYKLGSDVMIALDVAANEFYQDGVYNISSEGRSLNTMQMLEYLLSLSKTYPIFSIEDALAEDDFDGWREFTKAFSIKDNMIVGDDLFVTNITYLREGVALGMANTILIKPNQVGTISEMFNTIEYAKKYKYRTIMSHRSGDTEDTAIAHFAIAFASEFIKSGALSRSERLAKYNEIIRIEEYI